MAAESGTSGRSRHASRPDVYPTSVARYRERAPCSGAQRAILDPVVASPLLNEQMRRPSAEARLMNKDQLQGKWHQMKGEVQRQWGKLTNDDLDQVNGNLEKLVGVVQERYGYVRQRAQDEVDAFRKQQAEEAATSRPIDPIDPIDATR
jgi:uncharacterized protein YjbJ (UPF0337 family)